MEGTYRAASRYEVDMDPSPATVVRHRFLADRDGWYGPQLTERPTERASEVHVMSTLQRSLTRIPRTDSIQDE